jgi:hypothetical protein
MHPPAPTASAASRSKPAEAIRLQRAARDWTGLAYFLEALAWCTSGTGRAERAAHLLGAANAVWRLSGAKAYEAPPYQAVDDQVAQVGRAQLGEAAYEAAFQAGNSSALDQVIAYALEEKPARPGRPTTALTAPAPRGEHRAWLQSIAAARVCWRVGAPRLPLVSSWKQLSSLASI